MRVLALRFRAVIESQSFAYPRISTRTKVGPWKLWDEIRCSLKSAAYHGFKKLSVQNSSNCMELGSRIELERQSNLQSIWSSLSMEELFGGAWCRVRAHASILDAGLAIMMATCLLLQGEGVLRA